MAVVIALLSLGCARTDEAVQGTAIATDPIAAPATATPPTTAVTGTSLPVVNDDAPCVGSAGPEIGACLAGKLPAMEAQLRELTDKFAFEDAQHKAELDKMDEDWLAQRNSDCATLFLYQRPGGLPGHGMGPAYASCRYELTKARLQLLQRLIG